MLQDLHDDDVVSRASSASSSPRYPAALMAQVAAAMAAAGTVSVGSPTGSSIQSFLLAQQQRAQQAQHAQQVQQRQTALGQSHTQSGAGQLGSYQTSVTATASSGLRGQYGVGTGTVPRSSYGPQRHAALPLVSTVFTPQGTLTAHCHTPFF